MVYHRNPGRPLNVRQQKFVEQFLITGNGREAALRAGYSRSGALSSSRLRKIPYVAEAIRRGRAAAARSAQVERDRVVLELARVAFSDIGEVLDWTSGDDLTLRPKTKISPHHRAAIAEIAPRRMGQGPRIKFHNKARALEALVRVLGGYDKLVPAAPPPYARRDGRDARTILVERLTRLAREPGKSVDSLNAGAPLTPPAFEDSAVMPGRSAGHPRLRDVDGRDTPGHDAEGNPAPQPSTFSPSPPERGRGQSEGV